MFIKNLQAKIYRRDHILIVSDMLSCAIEGIRRNDLMLRAKLSSAQINKYMPLLIESELMEICSNKERLTYKTTIKGKSFLEKSGKLLRLLA
jgi:predicted transcriptional regulator